MKNRREYLFLYDVTYANPNGDPNDENKPRIDEESGRNIVTDVRLKRTVRDYLHEYENQEIFVREIEDENGYIQDAKTRAKDFLKDESIANMSFQEQKELIKNKILTSCIDVRLFGATIPLELVVGGKKKQSSITLTGAVQFNMGESLHRVKLEFIKGTGAFASDSKKEQKTFREEWILPYALIAFHGVANEQAAKYTNLQDDDLEALKRALWYGTKNLITRSKFGQMPRLLLEVVYKEGTLSHIGDLQRFVSIKSTLEDEAIRTVADYELETENLLEMLNKKADIIKEVNYFVDEALRLTKPLTSEKVPFKKMEL